ncbi:MAG: carboxypeptidase-like regulatory domain-containing protein [Bacteroidota bacterium]
MKYLIIIGSFFFITVGYAQQNGFLVSGTIKDSATGNPVSNVGVSVLGSKNTVETDGKGNYSITVKRFPATLLLSHVSYEKKNIVVNRTGKFDLVIRNKMNELPVFPVSIEKPTDLMPEFPVYIWDYEMCGDSLFAFLGFDRMSMSKPGLYLCDFAGNVKSNVAVAKKGKLVRDCMGALYYVTTTTASVVTYDERGIRLTTESDAEDFEELISPCVEHDESRFYLKGFYSNRQKLTYFIYDQTIDTLREIVTISDIVGLDILKDKPRMMSMKGYDEFSERFEQLCMYKPVFAPLIKMNDSLIIFDFENNKIEYFDLNGKVLSEKKLFIQKKKDLKGEFYVDKSRQKMYTLFQKGGLTELAEISSGSAKVVRTIQVPGFAFIEKIRIHDGMLYFLYKDDTRAEYKKIFKMKLG